VCGFAIIGLCVQYVNIKAMVVYKIARDSFGKCVGTLSTYTHIFQFFLVTWVSNILLMKTVMTVNFPQLKTGVAIILYMHNKVKSKKFMILWYS